MATRNGFNGTLKIVAIAANGGSTALLATGPARYVRMVESTLDAAGAANVIQGFEYQLISVDLATGISTPGPWIPVNPGNVAELGDLMSKYSSHGSILGNGPSNIIGLPPTPATVLCNLRSQTVTATSVIVEQYY